MTNSCLLQSHLKAKANLSTPRVLREHGRVGRFRGGRRAASHNSGMTRGSKDFLTAEGSPETVGSFILGIWGDPSDQPRGKKGPPLKAQMG